MINKITIVTGTSRANGIGTAKCRALANEGKFPMGRIGESRDAAKLIVFLASDESEWITGQIIHSDGGFRN